VLAFTTNSSQLVSEALQHLVSEQGAQALLLDLRDNPGGVVSEGLDIASDFLDEGAGLCYASDRSGVEELARVEGSHVLARVPLALLVNGGSASTSELLAGALRDELGALLVGERTFGKGRTQRVVGLADGSTLLVSTMAYKTPKKQVQRGGGQRGGGQGRGCSRQH
jgi:C-terminal peptidase prc